MKKKDAVLVHSPSYADWVFDKSHPTQGRRFVNARDRFIAKSKELNLDILEVEPRFAHSEELERVHAEEYVYSVFAEGLSDEWMGTRQDLGRIARDFVGGTLTGIDHLLNGDTELAIHFAGAKHHAMRDYANGFCVFNDFAVGAKYLTDLGERVSIFDCDAHHGDGTEVLLKHDKNVQTFSVHEYGIFPGTGLVSDWKTNSYNFPLSPNTGDDGLALATASFIESAVDFKPTFIFIACGADGLSNDPLSSLRYTSGGYTRAMTEIKDAFYGVPILFGGAGGYLPDNETPDLWVEASLALI